MKNILSSHSTSFKTNNHELNYSSSVDNQKKITLNKKLKSEEDSLDNKPKMGQKISKFPYLIKGSFDDEEQSNKKCLITSKSVFDYAQYRDCSNELDFRKRAAKNGRISHLKYSISFPHSFQPTLTESDQYRGDDDDKQTSASSTSNCLTDANLSQNSSRESANSCTSVDSSSFSSENITNSSEETKNITTNRHSTSSTLSSISSINSDVIKKNDSINFNLKVFKSFERFFLIKN